MELPFPHKKWTGQDWDQVKNLTKIELIGLLQKDKRWRQVETKGGRYIFFNPQHKSPYQYLAIHYHKAGIRDKHLLRSILDHWCCTREDFVSWKVIKR